MKLITNLWWKRVFKIIPLTCLNKRQLRDVNYLLGKGKRSVRTDILADGEMKGILALFAFNKPIGAISYFRRPSMITNLYVDNRNPLVDQFRKFAGHSAGEELVRQAVNRFEGDTFYSNIPVRATAKRWIRRIVSKAGGRADLVDSPFRARYDYELPPESKSKFKPKLPLSRKVG
ncbi:hypothetical protein HY991_02970 [Candidatus Micrarchaeota archaeon]|nr:hypothetical protein [Candidatus Micrarchaeota archaeon]